MGCIDVLFVFHGMCTGARQKEASSRMNVVIDLYARREIPEGYSDLLLVSRSIALDES